MTEQYKPYAASYLLLRRDNLVLLSRRAHVHYMSGYYSLPAGHFEEGETPKEVMVREAREEIGVQIETSNLHCVKIQHHEAPERMSINYFFECHVWTGEITIMEPNKCDDLAWFDIDSLPNNIVPEVLAVLLSSEDVGVYQEFSSITK